MEPINNKGYKLLHQGCLALSQVEMNGMKIDVDYTQRAIQATAKRIDKLEDELKKDEVFKTWRKRYGSRLNINSREQLGEVLFNILKYPCPERTKTGRPKTDEAILERVDIGFVAKFLKVMKLKKAKSTYLEGILRETTDGFLHPFFHLNMARTFRSSSSDPNFQNIPVRDPIIKKLVRRMFIARPNHRIVEVDYNGAEICCAACYHKDPVMIKYIKDDTKDLHRDMAMQCYKLKLSQVNKEIRYCGKNMFVFPQFYGDYYLMNAKSLWEAMVRLKLKTNDGTPLIKHIKAKGIKGLGSLYPKDKPKAGTFVKHLQEVENDFWGRRFKVYNEWKKEWYDEYLENGYFETLTGFRIEAVMRRNQVINTPVQGSAFHWLLWSLIEINKVLRKHKMKSLIIGQIHDSIVSDVHKKEVKNYLEIVQQVMTQDIRKHWKWIIVPLAIEAEVAPIGGSWYEKKEIEL